MPTGAAPSKGIPPRDRLPDPVPVPDRPGLEIRLWQVADASALAEMVTSSIEHLRPWMPWIAQEPMSLEARLAQLTSSVAEWERGGDAFYGMWLDGRPVGAIGAHHRIGPDGLEIGYWLRPEAVGTGLVTSSVRALTEALMALPWVTHVEIRNDAANVRSAAVPQRCGYRLVAEHDRPSTAPAETGRGQVWRFGADPQAPAEG